jgi:ABC-type transporter Mla MlaB component
LLKASTFREQLTPASKAACRWNSGCSQAGLSLRIYESRQMLKITRAANGEVVFTVSGRLDADNLAELKTLFSSEATGRHIALDVKELTRVDQDAVSFLERCEADNIQLRNCPAYIREWITRERSQG